MIITKGIYLKHLVSLETLCTVILCDVLLVVHLKKALKVLLLFIEPDNKELSTQKWF